MSAERQIRVLVCVDDTDDLTKETSTGEVAEAIAGAVKELGGSLELEISRHQLLIDESVPYTSHNSAMAFVARIREDAIDEAWDRGCSCVRSMMAQTADPGLCMACIPEDDSEDELLYELIAYGQRCKREYVSKEESYALASRIPWVRLEELGGDGQGVVGALAGAGLRLGGNDGRFRGKWDLKALVEGGDFAHNKRGGKGRGGGRGDGSGGGGGGHKKQHGSKVASSQSTGSFTVAQVCEALGGAVNGRVCVVDSSGKALADSVTIASCDEVKPVLFAGQLAVVAEVDEEGIAHPCTKAELEELHGDFADMDRVCSAFELDNDLEETLDASGFSSCPNCLYRRWTASGFTCMRPVEAPDFSEAIR